MEHIAWLDDYDPELAPVLGGKNTSLGLLIQAGLPVPPGFAITADAYRETVRESELSARLDALLEGVDPDDPVSLSAGGSAARALVLEAQLPEALVEAIRASYAELSARCGTDDVPVAVRSSATCEDQPDASFAGEHDTYLWVRGADSVVEHVQRCWASLFTDRAIAYRRQMAYAEDIAAMSVGVQKMVLPKAAGVAFTLNPHDGDRSQVAIDASWGFGEAVVSGSVTPDNFMVDKVLRSITKRTISDKHIEHRLDGSDRVIEAEVEAERRTSPCLTDAEVQAVAALARQAEKHFGCPQDVEWALDDQLPDGENVLLLQSRPETVWSRKTRVPDPRDEGDNYLTSIVRTLMSPDHRPATTAS